MGRQRAPLDAAVAALARRDRSAAELAADLARRGVPADEAEAALGRLAELGYLDDARFAAGRAAALAARGYGDEAVRHDLEQRGVAAEAAAHALSLLEPERERARALARRLATPAAAARRLAAKGFSEDAIESALSGAPQ